MKNQTASNALTRAFRPLSPKQRSYIGGLADSTRRMLIARGAIEAADETAQAWRHRECREATRQRDPQGMGWTISEAPASAFDDLLAHFQALGGHADKALATLTGDSNEMRQMSHNIGIAAKACGVGENYIAGICRRMFRRDSWITPAEGKKVLIALTDKARKTQA
jgi:hypothetical protein